MQKNIADLKQEFISTVCKDNIKYDWDGGHAYSYLDHPLIDIEFEDEDEDNEWMDFTNEWLYENDELPPCQISVWNGVVESSCGCHDYLDIDKDREEIEDIITELERIS